MVKTKFILLKLNKKTFELLFIEDLLLNYLK
jgi:hypothetical protein